MLSYGVTDDRELIKELTKQIFGQAFDWAVAYVFYLQGRPIGIANLSVTPSQSEIKMVGILPASRKNGYGDFFTRSLMLRLSEVSEKIVAYSHDYFYKFGFVLDNEKMVIDSDKLDFPSNCKHQKEE